MVNKTANVIVFFQSSKYDRPIINTFLLYSPIQQFSAMKFPHKLSLKVAVLLLIFILSTDKIYCWGFFAHKQINKLAVFTLPPEMIKFYKSHIHYLSEHAVDPDKRRYVIPEEAARHFLDADVYGDSAIYKLPRYWKQAKDYYSEDTLNAYGIVPWHIQRVAYNLTEAFKEKDGAAILKLSADIGHYIADANVPLHTTENYNGQLTNQVGIHGLWESRLPELFTEDYDFFVGKAVFAENIQLRAWSAVIQAHEALDSVFSFEKSVSLKFPEEKKYGYEDRGATTVRVYSRDFSDSYHKLLKGQVERQMRASIKMVGDIWYTCWLNAGQPDLSSLSAPIEEVLKSDDNVDPDSGSHRQVK